MKNIIFYLLAFNLSVGFAQKISFKIENDAENIKIDFTNLSDKVLKSVFEQENNFTVNYLGFDEGYYLLKTQGKEVVLYLKPSDDLIINFDSANFYKTFTFSGTGAAINNYLISKYVDKLDRRGNLTPFHKKEFYEGDEEHFLDKVDGYYKGLFSSLFSRSFDKKFKDQEMKDLNYAHSFDLLKYQDAKKHFKQKDSLAPSDYFLEPLNDINYENFELYKRHNSYKELIIEKWAKDIVNTEDFNAKKDIFESIRIKPLQEKVLEYLFFSMKRNTPQETDFYYNLIKKRSKNSKLYADVKEKYSQIQYSEAEKNLSKFKFIDVDKNKASLATFKGKHIFVKIWVNFCKSCIQDLKELDMLKRKYGSAEIAFVGISVDKKEDFEVWKETVISNEIQIPQFFLNDSRIEFFETYDISQIPRFILLSNKGIPLDINIKNFNTKKTENIIRDILKH